MLPWLPYKHPSPITHLRRRIVAFFRGCPERRKQLLGFPKPRHVLPFLLRRYSKLPPSFPLDPAKKTAPVFVVSQRFLYTSPFVCGPTNDALVDGLAGGSRKILLVP